VQPGYLGLHSLCSLQPRLEYYGPSALKHWAIHNPLLKAASGHRTSPARLRGESISCDSLVCTIAIAGPSGLKHCVRCYRCTRAPAPFINFSTSSFDAIEVSPGVVMAKAPWTAP